MNTHTHIHIHTDTHIPTYPFHGLRIASFHGHFFIRGVDLLAPPNVNQVKISHAY
jgi:hypothetical protein